MTDYSDLPCVACVPSETIQHTFNEEKNDDDIERHLTQSIVDLIQQRGFDDYDPSCIRPLQACLVDFYKDLIQRFKLHLECLGTTPMTVQDVFERTLSETLSINLRQLHRYMKES